MLISSESRKIPLLLWDSCRASHYRYRDAVRPRWMNRYSDHRDNARQRLRCAAEDAVAKQDA